MGLQRLRELAPRPERLKLVYHGLDFAHLPPPPAARPRRDGSDPADPVVILSIGRKVEKKGYDDLLDALALLPRDAALALRAYRRRRARRCAEGAGRSARHRRALHLARRPAAEGGVRRPRARRPVRAGQQEGRRRRPGRPAQRADGGGPPGPRRSSRPAPRRSASSSRTATTACWCAPGAPDELAAALARLVARSRRCAGASRSRAGRDRAHALLLRCRRRLDRPRQLGSAGAVILPQSGKRCALAGSD